MIDRNELERLQPMTTEERALALVNEVRVERGLSAENPLVDPLVGQRRNFSVWEALCRAIEAHEADNARNEQRLADQAKAFSDAVKRLIETGKAYDKVAGLVRGTALDEHVKSIDALRAFILPEPDPLVEALDKMLRRRTMHPDREVLADEAAFLTAELAARGYKIERIAQ